MVNNDLRVAIVLRTVVKLFYNKEIIIIYLYEIDFIFHWGMCFFNEMKSLFPRQILIFINLNRIVFKRIQSCPVSTYQHYAII